MFVRDEIKEFQTWVKQFSQSLWSKIF